MKRPRYSHAIRRMDLQVSLFTAAAVIVSCLLIFAIHYKTTYDSMISALVSRVEAMHDFIEDFIDIDAFNSINTKADMETQTYKTVQSFLYRAKVSAEIRYLYTAKRAEDGTLIYAVDGLKTDAEDFRYPGDKIEPEIIPELESALNGETVMPRKIKQTDWGKIFIAYLPIHDGDAVVGAIGMEFPAEMQYDVYRTLRIVTPIVILLICLTAVFAARIFFRRISNPLYRDLLNTDQLTQLKNRNAYEVDLHNFSGQRAQNGMWLYLIDLNSLKYVNDVYGHDAGDRYLQSAAAALSAAAPDAVGIYRIGGDEFVILTEYSKDDMESRINDEFLKTVPDWGKDLKLAVGGAKFNSASDKNLSDTYRRADAVMYKSKQEYYKTRPKTTE